MSLNRPHFSGSIKLAPSVTKAFQSDLSTTIQWMQNAQDKIKAWPDDVKVEVHMDDSIATNPQTRLKNTGFPDLEAAVNNQYYKLKEGLPNYVHRVIEIITNYFQKKADETSGKVTWDEDVKIHNFKESTGQIKKLLEEVEADDTLLPNAKIHFKSNVGPGGWNEGIRYDVSAQIRIGDHENVKLPNNYPLKDESPLEYVKRIVRETQKLTEVLL